MHRRWALAGRGQAAWGFSLAAAKEHRGRAPTPGPAPEANPGRLLPALWPRGCRLQRPGRLNHGYA